MPCRCALIHRATPPLPSLPTMLQSCLLTPIHTPWHAYIQGVFCLGLEFHTIAHTGQKLLAIFLPQPSDADIIIRVSHHASFIKITEKGPKQPESNPGREGSVRRDCSFRIYSAKALTQLPSKTTSFRSHILNVEEDSGLHNKCGAY